jgi:hypothetical protein
MHVGQALGEVIGTYATSIDRVTVRRRSGLQRDADAIPSGAMPPSHDAVRLS